jgi:hypothetical protein
VSNVSKKLERKGWKLENGLPASLERLKITRAERHQVVEDLKSFVIGMADFVESKTTTHPNIRAI